MSESDRVQLFDDWADNYDVAVTDGEFPFDGYEQVLDEVARLADVKPQMRILDLGIGTGNLAARFIRVVGLQATYQQVSSCGGVFTFTARGAG
jgi:ubiquinone/menaquinone biosynthesis C-methylase UbiE